MTLLRIPDETTNKEKVRSDVVSIRAKDIPIQRAQWAEELLGDLTYEDVKRSNSVAALMFNWVSNYYERTVCALIFASKIRPKIGAQGHHE